MKQYRVKSLLKIYRVDCHVCSVKAENEEQAENIARDLALDTIDLYCDERVQFELESITEEEQVLDD